MKLVDLPDNYFFFVLNNKRLKGFFLKLEYMSRYNLVAVTKAPFFDKTFWLDPLLEIKKNDEE